MAAILMNTTKMLLSDVGYVRLSLVEGTGDRVKVRGEFAKCGVATENRRVYPGKVWEKEIKRLDKALQNRRVLGEVDHPSDGQTKLARVSHIVTGLQIKDGVVIGEAEILPTDAGRNLLALMQSNVPVGVSSRGFGSVKTNEKNEDVVQEDYKLVTFDFVADPADVDAYPQVAESRNLFEGVQFDMDDEQEKALEFARRIEAEKTGNKVESEETLREQFAREILGNLASIKAEAVATARQELLADPSFAGAKAALESIRAAIAPFLLPEETALAVQTKTNELSAVQNDLAEARLRIKELEEENTALASMAKEVGYRFFLERTISGEPKADLIRRLVGDVKVYENSDAIKTRIEAIKVELAQQETEKQADVEAKAKEVAEAKAASSSKHSALESKISQIEGLVRKEQSKRERLEQQLEEAQQQNADLQKRLYAESRIASHPKASKLRPLVESARDVEAVDEILESAREPERDEDELQNIRARVRSRMRVESRQDDEMPVVEARQARNKNGQDYLGLGMSLDALQRLSGIASKR